MLRIRRRIYIDNHRFTLQDPERWVKHPAYPNGLISTVGPDGASVLTGTPAGHIWLTMEWHTEEPRPDLDPWDEVVEVCYECTTGEIRVIVEGVGAMDFPNLAFAGAGHYQLRAHARGRAQGQADPALDVEEAPVEHHLVQFWTVPYPAGDVILKSTDVVGAFK
jgi:hypothetical protein